MMKLCFHSAAITVTGTKHLITLNDGTKILLDCGLFQGLGLKTHELNENVVFDPKTIDFILLSHAHIDHSGLIPKLVRDGFKGNIYCTPTTRELTEILLIDSAEIQMHEVEYQSNINKASGLPQQDPLYTLEDVQQSFQLFTEICYDEPFQLMTGVTVVFRNTGHLIGSASIHITSIED